MGRKILVGILSILLLSVVLSSLAYAVPNQAADVEITPKISVKGVKGRGDLLKHAATGILGEPLGQKASKWAVVIGISDYHGDVNDLEYADDDALDMKTALITVYGYSKSNVILLIDASATRNNIVLAINSLKGKVNTSDEVVFFYSGHGARGKANDGDKEIIDEAIVPWECTAESLIWDGELAQMFSSFKTSRIIFIFDSCYAGGMTDLMANGRIVVMACSESGLSYEFSTLENGQFTYYFVERGILFGKADIWDHDADGSFGEASDIAVEEAFDYAKANCKYQKPAIKDSFPNDLLP